MSAIIAPKQTKIFSALAGLETIDETAGVIRGVAVITAGIPSDNRIDRATGNPLVIDQKSLDQVQESAKTYNSGLKVKADHGSGIFSVTGYLKNFRMSTATNGQPCLRADLFILESEPNKPKIFEMARKIPDTFGLSISCGGQDENLGATTALRCEEIYSADLVPDPAANPSGLFSSQVDASNKTKSPSQTLPTMADTADTLKQCSDMLAAAKAEHETRFSAVENSLSELKKMMDVSKAINGAAGAGASPHADFAALQTQVKELVTQFGEVKTLAAGLQTELASMPVKLAKEFAATVGNTQTRTGGGDNGNGAPGGDAAKAGTVEGFESTVKKHFAATHSKGKAMSAAIAEDRPGYDAFMAAGRRDVKYV